MFNKKLVFKVNDMEAVNFCRLLGKHKVRFNIGPAREFVIEDSKENRKGHYREFAVYTSRRKAKVLSEDINKKCWTENYI